MGQMGQNRRSPVVKKGCQKELMARMNRNARKPRASMGEHKDSESGHACLHTGKREGDDNETLNKGWGSSCALEFEYYVHRAVVLGNTTS